MHNALGGIVLAPAEKGDHNLIFLNDTFARDSSNDLVALIDARRAHEQRKSCV